jgi:hypothetical protein
MLASINTAYSIEMREKIAIIDTGINVAPNEKQYICEDGLHDMTGTGITDRHGHGNNIAHIIMANMKPTQCLIIIKYVDSQDKGLMGKALLKALEIRPIFLNLSVSGTDYDSTEHAVLSELVDSTKIVVAAGNDSMNLNSESCNIFPACYDFKKNFYVVGSKNAITGNPSAFSNYGIQVKHYENGEYVYAGGKTLSGSSQAAAIFTGKLIRK